MLMKVRNISTKKGERSWLPCWEKTFPVESRLSSIGLARVDMCNSLPEKLCPVCGSADHFFLKKYVAVSKCFQGLSLVSCNNCGFVGVNTPPLDEALSEYYSQYWQPQDSSNLNFFHECQAKARVEYIKDIVLHRSEMKILDVGAGFGLIGSVLGERFGNLQFIYDVVESDPVALKALADNHHVAKIYSNLSEVVGNYDLIILSHILEHFYNPLKLVKDMIGKIVDNGYFFIEVPNSDYIYKSKNEPHLSYFNQETLGLAIINSGLTIVEIDSCGISIDIMKKIYRIQCAMYKLTKALPFVNAFDTVEFALTRNKCESVSKYGGGRQWIRAIAQLPK